MRPGIAVALLLAGCSARPPGRIETAIATRAKHLLVGGRGERNPLPATPAEIERGRRTFSQYCLVCHGLDGQATGVPFAATLSPPVPSLASRDVQAYADGQLHRVIRDGIFPSGMPAARGLLSDEEIWRIVVWLRHLPPAGSLGEPAVYAGDPAGAGR
ncbi:MAG TPA: cytochrome c [Anaeromyxobacter sp.]|nr:cytochrome c [Anaeromyxobacter sp.]